MNEAVYLAVGVLLVVIAAVAYYSWHHGAATVSPSAGVAASDINAIASVNPELNVPPTIGSESNEANIPSPGIIAVDSNDTELNLPPAI